ncbi:hypothetical protein ASG36_02915 [Geodermatophilus sp. Leaf369]|nr:hypothetical protein ASG36_02915 [Geodermatophilus sp. Leaf369]
MNFIGLLPAPAYTTEGRFSGIDYGCHIGYVWMVATWRAESQQRAWFEQRELSLPLFNGSVREKLRWLPRLAGMEYKHAREKVASLTKLLPGKFKR